MADDCDIVDFSAADNSSLFKFNQKITGTTGDDGTKNVEIMALLKDLSNIIYEINPILTWSANCVISNADVNQATTFAIADTKLYVPVVTFSILYKQNCLNN